MSVIMVERKVLERNDAVAEENRTLLQTNGVFSVNLLSSPGSGKTSLLEQTLQRLRHEFAIAVIEGDIQTDLDAKRIEALGVPTAQIITGGGCHLDANLVKKALATLPVEKLDLLFIENVGNLVCPAAYDLGENIKAVVISVTEGEEKPLKYPAIFRNAALCIVNKIDLLPFLNFSVERLKENARAVNPQLQIVLTSCTTGEGIDEWCNLLRTLRRKDPSSASV